MDFEDVRLLSPAQWDGFMGAFEIVQIERKEIAIMTGQASGASIASLNVVMANIGAERESIIYGTDVDNVAAAERALQAKYGSGVSLSFNSIPAGFAYEDQRVKEEEPKEETNEQ